jgi:hypothetical protein
VPKATPVTAPTSAPAPTPTTAEASAETAESKDKRAKNLNKKLKAIQEIKAKQAAGQTLEPEQVSTLQLLLNGAWLLSFTGSSLCHLMHQFQLKCCSYCNSFVHLSAKPDVLSSVVHVNCAGPKAGYGGGAGG